MRLLCALGLFLALLHVTSCLLIGAFNIQTFGDMKSRKKNVMDRIKLIVRRYDIILIQEVLDKKGKATKRLMKRVNEGLPRGSPRHFSCISSKPLGPRSYKERYLFLYRDKTVSVKDSYQYTGKVFMRPPFFVLFSSPQTAVKNFVLIPIHTKPGKAVKELKALVKVVAAAEKRWSTKNIMVLGDFNAGKYLGRGDWSKIPLFTNTNYFHWLIANNVDTTVSRNGNAYDRIVVTTNMYRGVNPRSAGIFDFKNQYHLTPDEAKAVSDHFPVEVKLS